MLKNDQWIFIWRQKEGKLNLQIVAMKNEKFYRS